MFQIKLNNEVVLGGLLMGVTGILIGVVISSLLTMFIAGTLGLLIGTLVGWIGGRFYLFIVCFGSLVGAYFGYQTGDRDILIIASGTGAAIAGFLGAQASLFIKK